MDRQSMFYRFPLHYRVEHWVLAINFTLLAITGLVQMFADSPISVFIVGLFGNVDNVRIWHHVCAIILILETIVHIGFVRYRAFIRLSSRMIAPTIRDMRVAWGAFLYNIGLSTEKPKEGRYTFAEKAEYWAVVWGVLIMATTGFMMWNPIATTHYLSGEWIPAAKVAHGLEAVLAVLAIIIWHFYFVLVKHFNPSMYHGYISREQMEKEHPLELEDILSGRARHEVDPEAKIRFWKHCFPQYVMLSVIFLILTYRFITFENTSVRNLPPPEDVEIFSPLNTPGSRGALISDGKEKIPGYDVTIIPSEFTWENSIADIFASTCTSCHGVNGSAGLNLTDHAALMSSGVITQGDADNSRLIKKVGDGSHYAKFSDEDLEKIKSWIMGGAPLNDSGPVLATAGQSGMSWSGGISAMLSSCTSCHGAQAMGGLDLRSYATVMKAGVVKSGNPDGSKLVTKIADGSHMGKLSDSDLQSLKNWITAGAPEGDAAAAEATGGLSWETGISDIFSSCTSCHGASAMAGLDLRSYDSLMAKGVITKGNPDGSAIVAKLTSGSHVGRMSDANIAKLKTWIKEGAPGAGGAVEEEPAGEGQKGLTWETGVGDILSSCTACHGAGKMGGLDLRTLESTMSSGKVVPGNASGSRLIIVIKDGTHMGKLSAPDLQTVMNWINEGAKGAGSPQGETPTEEPYKGDLTWDGGIGNIFNSNCTACHGAGKMAGFDARTYNSFMDSNVIKSGSPSASKVVQKMESGTHPGKMTGPELEAVRKWIQAGAPKGGKPEPEPEPEPETPKPEPEPAPDEPEELYWDDVLPILESSCNSCHGAGKMGGLDMRTYQSLIDADIIDLDNPDKSELITKVKDGTHMGKFTEPDLKKILEWIKQGALEKPGVKSASLKWNDIFIMLESSCLGCHGASASGGINMTTYDTFIASNAIEPGNPDSSRIVIKMKAGGHFGKLDDDQLAKLIVWIKSGAPE